MRDTPMTTNGLQSTVRDMWDTRPARPRDDRMIAGVAAGIARRYDVDPVLIRVGFVAAAMTGIGALLYVALWIALPDAPAEPGAPPPARPKPLLAILVFVGAVFGIGTLFRGGGWLFPLLAIAGLAYLMHHFRGDRGPARPGPAPTEHATPAVSLVKEPGGAPADAGRTTPPAWDPLGAAPFAWDLPEPAPLPEPPAPRGFPVTTVVLGIALLGAGITAAIMLLTGSLSPATAPILFGVPLALIGAGLVAASFVHRGRGLVPFAVLLIAVTWGVIAAPWNRWGPDRMVGMKIQPTTVADLAPTYSRPVGDIDLDLRRLDLSVPPGAGAEPVQTRVTLGAGDVEIHLPATADVTFTGNAGVGDVEYGHDQKVDGPGAHLVVTDDLGSDGIRSGRPLVLDVSSGTGDVEVRRG